MYVIFGCWTLRLNHLSHQQLCLIAYEKNTLILNGEKEEHCCASLCVCGILILWTGGTGQNHFDQ